MSLIRQVRRLGTLGKGHDQGYKNSQTPMTLQGAQKQATDTERLSQA